LQIDIIEKVKLTMGGAARSEICGMFDHSRG